MLNIPVLRWGQPYTSLETDEVRHFATGEPIAKVSQANAGLVQRDMRKAAQARAALRQIPIHDLIGIIKKAADLYAGGGTLPLGDGTQSPAEFAKQQSSTTGLPEHMCLANMKKNHFVLSNMEQILTSLTRPGSGRCSREHGEERGDADQLPGAKSGVGTCFSLNSPGVPLWLPHHSDAGGPCRRRSAGAVDAVPDGGSVLSSGRATEAISVVGPCRDKVPPVLAGCDRSLIFGGTPTVEQYKESAFGARPRIPRKSPS
ncbi:MAG: hypothetical protein U1D30_17130 [Planctomycetota bacterium]